MLQVALVQAIHELYRRKNWSKRRIARELHVDIKTVRRVLDGEWCGTYTLSSPRARPAREQIEASVRELLEAERAAHTPRKQRLRATSIWRLLVKQGVAVSESTVTRVVREVREELGDWAVVAMVPLAHDAGLDAQADFLDSQIETPRGREWVYHLLVRACYSRRTYVHHVPAKSAEALFEGLIAAFEYFGGVFPNLWFDNLRPAVRKVLEGRDRLVQERFKAFQAHYGFHAEFCAPAKGNEKGGVEREVQEFRAHVMTPLPFVQDGRDLDGDTALWMERNDNKPVSETGATVAELWEAERVKLIPLPKTPYEVRKPQARKVSAYSLVQFGTNFYSVPVRFARRTLWVRSGAWDLDICDRYGAVIYRHARLSGRGKVSFCLDHYLDLLERKPRSFDRAAPVKAARQEWPETYSHLLESFRSREGEADGTRAFIQVLRLHELHPAKRVHLAVAEALTHPQPCLALVLGFVVAAQRAESPPESVPDAVVRRWPHVRVMSITADQYSRLLRKAH